MANNKKATKRSKFHFTFGSEQIITPEKIAKELKEEFRHKSCTYDEKHGNWRFVTEDGIVGYVDASGFAYVDCGKHKDEAIHSYDVDWHGLFDLPCFIFATADDGKTYVIHH